MLTAESKKVAPAIQSLYIVDDRQIAAPIDIVFETLLEPQGEFKKMNLKLEAWPGGRWFRDLGDNTGHLWGHVQVIKPPKLLEITGPMMMSYAVAGFVQYRLTEKDGGTLLAITHQAFGMLSDDHITGVTKGWAQILEGVKAAAENQAAK